MASIDNAPRPANAPDRATDRLKASLSSGLNKHLRIYESVLNSARSQLAAAGLCLVVVAEFLRPSTLQSVLADAGIVTLASAAMWLLFENRGLERSTARDAPAAAQDRLHAKQEPGRISSWRWTMIGLGLFGALLCQSWFKPGTAIAGGDTTPPIGTAWIGDLFSRYAWTGNLGGPGQAQGNLPWAALDWLVHGLGGSGALSQRLWLSLLVAGVILAAAALLRSFGVSPLAGAIGAIFYLLNPFTLSSVGINDVWLVAMALLPALCAVVMAYAKGSFALWQVFLVLVLAAPFLGFAYDNPPLVGMLAAAFILSPFLARLWLGRLGGRKAFRAVVVGGLLIISVSAYWIIPAKIAVADVASGTLSSISSWGFTELRSTIANGLWLNDSWGWHYATYYPYASQFSRFPLLLVRVLVPVAGLSVLAVTNIRDRALAKVSGTLALVALAVVFLSTGTRSPGSLIFDRLYDLPYGWLLQIPGRFLMVSALCYAVLLAFLVEHLRIARRAGVLSHSSRRLHLAFGGPRAVTFASLGIIAVVLASSYPIWTGSMISGRQAGFPSTHVHVPPYWTETASYMNRHGPAGSMLVLPPDDFYAMPYTWYYGNDGFIVNLFKRHVVDPSGQSYDKVSTQLLNATALEASELVAHDFGAARRILEATGTPLVLVRGDIEAHFLGRHIVSPRSLASSLSADPEMHLVYRNGPLSIFGVVRPFTQPTSFATTTTTQPDLLGLLLLPHSTALVTSPPIVGHTALYQLPPVSGWQVHGSQLVTSVVERPGWTYRAVVLGAHGTSTIGSTGVSATTIVAGSGRRELELHLDLGSSILTDGTFADGLWQPHVGNCNDAVPAPRGSLTAKVLSHGGPSGEPALLLSAAMDGACEAKALSWTHGSLFLKMDTASGNSQSPPSMCLWEEPEARCAPVPSMIPSTRWRPYTAIVKPPPGTNHLLLFLYAMKIEPGPATELYSRITVRSITHDPVVEVIAHPTTDRSGTRLITIPDGYASGWKAVGAGRHVEVDGMRNGWFVRNSSVHDVHAVFTPVSSEVTDEVLVGVGTLLAALLVAVLGSARARRRIRPRAIQLSREIRSIGGRQLPQS